MLHRPARRSHAAILLLSTALGAVATPALADDHQAVSNPSDIVVTGALTRAAARATGTIEDARKEQHDAPNIINVLPQSEIKKIPDFTVAEAARRLPGVSMQSFSSEGRLVSIRGLDPSLVGVTYEGIPIPAGTLDSAGRAVPLDVVPASLVGGIEVTKSNRPDQDATALGGVLNLLTREMPKNGKPFGEVILGGGIETLRNTGVFNGSLVAGTRFGPSSDGKDDTKPFSLILTGTFNDDRRGYDDIEPSYIDSSSAPGKAPSTLDLRRYDQKRHRYGFGGTLTWDVAPGSTLYVKASDSGYTEWQDRHRLIYGKLGTGFSISPTDSDVYDSTGATLQQQLRRSKQSFETRLVKFGGLSQIDDVTLDYYGSYASNTDHKPYDYNATYAASGTYPVQVDTSDGQYPQATVTNGTDPTNTALYKLTAVSNAQSHDSDREWSGNVAASKPLGLGTLQGDIKIDAGLRLRHKTTNDPTETYSIIPTIMESQYPGGTDLSLYGGRYQLGTSGSTSAIANLITNDQALLKESAAADALSNAAAAAVDDENVYAGFVQYNGKIGRLGILTGVRFEATDGTYRGNSVTTSAAGTSTITPNANHAHYSNFFPTVQLRFDATDRLVARAAYSTAIGRPTFTQITAATSVSIGGGTVTTGNPDLKPTTANNFDVSLEYYLPKGGIISVGGFDKEFKNYIAATTINETYAGIAGIAQVTTYTNLKNSYARGVEFNYRQQFGFISPLLRNFGVTANYTYTDSHGGRAIATDETLPFTTKHTYNVGAFYNDKRLELQIVGSYAGRQLKSLGKTVATDTYIQPFRQWDVGARYHFTERLSVYAQARNITSARFVQSEGTGADKFTSEQLYGPTYLAGVDVSF